MTEHDPGGKVRIKLISGMMGSAEFSDCRRYRTSLRRWWGDDPRYMLWVGMNPSTAEADVDDPTIRREINFTIREGYTTFVKTNVMDYRATDPKDLLTEGVNPCSDENLEVIKVLARNASIVVVGFGSLQKSLRCYAVKAISAMLESNAQLMCLGTSKDGSPRHPLYLSKDLPFIEWDYKTWLERNGV